MTGRALHHLDLWVKDVTTAKRAWGWLLGELGWTVDFSDAQGIAWAHPDGTYLFLQAATTPGEYSRTGVGINHVAVTIESRDRLDALRAAAPQHGWAELFAEKYPHAGGQHHTALYLEDVEGLEVEVVAEA